jgi:hypothetical protein
MEIMEHRHVPAMHSHFVGQLSFLQNDLKVDLIEKKVLSI